MSSPRKTVGTVLISHQLSTNHLTDASGYIVGTAVDTRTMIHADVYLFHAFVEAASNANAQTWLIQACSETDDESKWVDVQTVTITFTGTPATEAITDGPFPATTKPIDVAATAEFVAGDQVYIQDANTLGDSEWARVDHVVTNVTVDLVDGLTNAKDSSDFFWDNPQTDKIPIDLQGVNRLRVAYVNRAAGANTHVMATMTTLDQYS